MGWWGRSGPVEPGVGLGMRLRPLVEMLGEVEGETGSRGPRRLADEHHRGTGICAADPRQEIAIWRGSD